jgi:hypothetical protein
MMEARPTPSSAPPCRICETPTGVHGRALVLGRHEVTYHRCPACGFVQTEAPFWLDEAYAEAITASDLGLVSRNLTMARFTRALVTVGFDAGGRFLDHGGGTGLLVRLLRDAGLDFRRSDAHAENVFARGFDGALDGSETYELVTAFEVLEHLVDPVGELRRILACTGSVFLSTVLLPEPAPAPTEHWYYGLEHGQHVSLFTRPALEALARRLGVRLLSRGSLHLLTREPIPAWAFRVATDARLSWLVNAVVRRPSLIARDVTVLSQSADVSPSR